MPTSSNGGGSGAACTELDFALTLDAIFAIFCATLNTLCDIAVPDLVEAVFAEPTFEATADTPPITTPESLQEAAADCDTGVAEGEGIGKAPDMIADPDLCICLDSRAGGMTAHPPSGLSVCPLLVGARVSGIMSVFLLSMPKFG
jgi:hypothetical protein